jgi:nucleotide-binding universal stress UspA family protein
VPTGVVPDPGAPVTVGVDLPDRSDIVLRAALRETASRQTGLKVLHVWSYPSPYEGVVITREDDARWAAQTTDEIHEALARVGVPAGVAVEVEARHAPPADALVEASRHSQLLVIGRHDPVVPIGSHLGPVARAVLREAGCPVLLAEPRPLRWRHANEQDDAASQPV